MSETVTIKPDMRVIHPEYGDITEDVARELAAINDEDNARLVRDAAARQRRLVEARPGEAVIHRDFALKAEIDPAVHAYWRMREGAGFWKHELDWFLKRHPECRVPQRAAAPTVRLTTLPTYRRGPTGRRGRWAL